MAKYESLDNIRVKMPEIFRALVSNNRASMNSRVHILDIGREALAANVYSVHSNSTREMNAYNSIYNKFISVVREVCAGRTVPSIDSDLFRELFTMKGSGVIFVDEPGNPFIVGVSFGAIRAFISNSISKHPKLRGSRFGEYTVRKSTGGMEEFSSRSKVDIGHIPESDNDNLTSPLEAKLLDLIQVATSPRIQAIAQKGLDSLYSLHGKYAYSFKNTAPENIAKARAVLGTGYIVVTLHTEKVNNMFSIEEGRILAKIKQEIVSSIQWESIPGSNTIIEDIIDSTVESIDGKKRLKPHKEKKGSGKAEVKGKAEKPSISKIKLTPGKSVDRYREMSVSSLKGLINRRLHDAIKANMGKGNAKTILNYRTGRFARSARVTGLLTDRKGAVQAFYEYMENPYATFAEGGAQQYPRSRDPTKLIEKSIRDVARGLMGNRMRAVLA